MQATCASGGSLNPFMNVSVDVLMRVRASCTYTSAQNCTD